MNTDVRVPTDVSGIEFRDVTQPQGESYYVFSGSTATTHSTPWIDLSNPIVIFAFGMILAFGISYLAYYIKKHGYTADEILETFYGLLGLSGIGFLIFGIIDIVLVGREGILYPVIGLLLIYAGGSFLSDLKKDDDYISHEEELSN